MRVEDWRAGIADEACCASAPRERAVSAEARFLGCLSSCSERAGLRLAGHGGVRSGLQRLQGREEIAPLRPPTGQGTSLPAAGQHVSRCAFSVYSAGEPVRGRRWQCESPLGLAFQACLILRPRVRSAPLSERFGRSFATASAVNINNDIIPCQRALAFAGLFLSSAYGSSRRPSSSGGGAA